MSRPSKHVMTSWPSIAVLFLLLLLPFYGPYAGFIDGFLSPVAKDWHVIETKTEGDKTWFRYAFTKLRDCVFVSIIVKVDGVPVQVRRVLDDDAASLGMTAPSGPFKSSILWEADTLRLKDAAIWFVHDCKMPWFTATRVQ